MKLAAALLAALILAAILNTPTGADAGPRTHGDGWCCAPKQ